MLAVCQATVFKAQITSSKLFKIERTTHPPPARQHDFAVHYPNERMVGSHSFDPARSDGSLFPFHGRAAPACTAVNSFTAWRRCRLKSTIRNIVGKIRLADPMAQGAGINTIKPFVAGTRLPSRDECPSCQGLGNL